MSLKGYKPKGKKAPWKLAQDAKKPKLFPYRNDLHRLMSQPASWFKPKPRKPVRQRSRRMTTIYEKLYKPMVARFLLLNRSCFVCGCKTTVNHHLRGRISTLLIDERFFRAACDRCHRSIHNCPNASIEAGLLAGRGEWGIAPRDMVTAGLQALMREASR